MQNLPPVDDQVPDLLALPADMRQRVAQIWADTHPSERARLLQEIRDCTAEFRELLGASAVELYVQQRRQETARARLLLFTRIFAEIPVRISSLPVTAPEAVQRPAPASGSGGLEPFPEYNEEGFAPPAAKYDSGCAIRALKGIC